MNIVWRNAAGEELELAQKNDATYLMLDSSVFGPAEYQLQVQQAPTQHGQTQLGLQLNPRTVRCSVVVRSNSHQQLMFDRAKLLSMFSPLTTGDLPNAGILKIEDDDRYYELQRVTPQGVELGVGRGNAGALFQRAQVFFRVDDPFVYAAGTVSQAINNGSDTTVGNVGNVFACPTFVLTGAGTTFIFANETSLETITLTSCSTVAGEMLTVITDFGIRSIVHKVVGTGVETNWYEHMTAASRWIKLLVGSNTLHCSWTGAGTCVVNFRPRYIGI